MDRTERTYTYGNPDADTVLIQMIDDHDHEGMESEVAEIRKLTDADFYLIAIKVQNWNADLSPWPAPAVFGKEGFGNGAADTLAEVLRICDKQDKTYIIGGYSLAGLFALWAAYQTDVFKGVAAASPSVWFCQVFFHWFGGMLEKESFRFVSGRSREHFLADQLLDAFFKTCAVSFAEMQENRIRSVTDGKNKRRFLCFLCFFDNRGIVHVSQ